MLLPRIALFLSNGAERSPAGSGRKALRFVSRSAIRGGENEMARCFFYRPADALKSVDALEVQILPISTHQTRKRRSRDHDPPPPATPRAPPDISCPTPGHIRGDPVVHAQCRAQRPYAHEWCRLKEESISRHPNQRKVFVFSARPYTFCIEG